MPDRAANYLICRVLRPTAGAIFRVVAKFFPALREGRLPGGVAVAASTKWSSRSVAAARKSAPACSTCHR